MAAQIYSVHNGPSAGAAAPVAVTTGTSIKTMLQLVNSLTSWRVFEWGISFNGITAATPITVELCATGTVVATGTALVANDITTYGDATGNAPPGITVGSTTGSIYTATAEGTVVAPVRTGDLQMIAPTNQYIKQFPLGREFEVAATHACRIRVTAPAAVSALCYINFEV